MNSEKLLDKTDYEYYIVVNDFESSNHLSVNKSTGNQYFATINEIYKAIYKSPIIKPRKDTNLPGSIQLDSLRHGQKRILQIVK